MLWVHEDCHPGEDAACQVDKEPAEVHALVDGKSVAESRGIFKAEVGGRVKAKGREHAGT